MRTPALAAIGLTIVATGAWFTRETAPMQALRARLPAAVLGAPTSSAIHKCSRPGGQTVYSDTPCPTGAREVSLGAPRVNVIPAIKAPPASAASSGTGLVTGFDQATIDRLREQQIDAATRR